MMRLSQRHRRLGSALAILLLVTCTPVHSILAAAPEAAGQNTLNAVAVMDVALGPNGQLIGRAVNERGEAWANAEVELIQHNATIAKPTTNGSGEFRVNRLKGGVYQVRATDSVTTFRAWTNGTAPPAASTWVTLSRGIYRGQSCTTPGCTTPGCGGRCGQGSALGFLMHPAVIAVGVAAAIAIPLALDDDDEGASN